MSYIKRIWFGTLLKCDPLGGTSYATLGALQDAPEGPDCQTTEVDTSILSDKWMTSAGGQIDPGTYTFPIGYDPLDTATTTVITGLLGSSAIASWELLFPVIASETQNVEPFKGWVKGFKRTGKKGSMVMAEVTVKISGAPGLAGE